MQKVVSAWPATTVGGTDIGGCSESAAVYHWHALLSNMCENVRVASLMVVLTYCAMCIYR